MGKKGKGGGGNKNSIKLKPNKNIFKAKFTAKAKDRKSHSKAVKTNLKKMSFDSANKIELLNADHNKVVLAPSSKPKPETSSSSITKRKPVEEEMPDVGGVTDVLANM